MRIHQVRAARAIALGLMAVLGMASANVPAADTPHSAKLSYVRLGPPGPDGISRFTDETLDLAPRGTAGMDALLAVHGLGDVKGATFASLKAGSVEDWHPAPRRQFMVCLRGIVEVTAGNGETRRITPGQFVLLEDTSGKGHITKALGTEDHVALAIPVADGVPARK